MERQGNYLQYTAFQKANVLTLVYECKHTELSSIALGTIIFCRHPNIFTFVWTYIYFPTSSSPLLLSHVFCTYSYLYIPYLLLVPPSLSCLSLSQSSVTILLLTLSPSLPYHSDWLLWCLSRVTGRCGPWSYVALTACYLHGDGWLRRCRGLLLTSAEDRAHTWGTLPTLSSSPLPLLFLSPSTFCPVFCGCSWESCCGAMR